MNPSNAPAYSYQEIRRPGVFMRGFAQCRPKRIDLEKLLHSIIFSSLNSGTSSDVLVFAHLSQSCQHRLKSDLVSFAQLRFCDPQLANVHRELSLLTQPTQVIFLAEQQPFIDERCQQLVTTHARLNPDASHKCLESLKGDWDFVSTGTELVFEDSPSRLRILELEAKTEKLWHRLSKYEAKKKGTIQPYDERFEVEAGFGICGFEIIPQGTRAVYSEFVETPLNAIGFGGKLAEQLALFLETHQLGFEQLRCAYICAPHLDLVAEVQQALPQLPIRVPDVQFGWLPQLSYFEALKSEQTSLIVNLEDFSAVNLMLVR